MKLFTVENSNGNPAIVQSAKRMSLPWAQNCRRKMDKTKKATVWAGPGLKISCLNGQGWAKK